MAGFFITATNTDRGKTTITTALKLWLERQGYTCLAMKPVQTGMAHAASNQPGCVLSPDLYTIYSASYGYGQKPTQEEIVQELGPQLHLLQPYCYQAACSPHLAAELEEQPYASLSQIKQCAQILQRDHCDVLLVEGAGGLLVPINRNKEKSLTMLDIAKELGLPVILISQSEAWGNQ